ncbi:MAG: PQQ-binding-like beta-propeller repeat protein, partial [Methanomassiliicoccales archaeon]
MNDLKVYYLRILALIVAAALLMTSGLLRIHHPNNILDNPTNENEGFIEPGSRSNTPTRAGTPWPMHLYDPVHSSYTVDIGPATADVIWNSSTADWTYSSPAVVNGKVFIGSRAPSNYGYMSCYYANNGSLAWRTLTEGSIQGGYGLTSSPAVENGYVFFAADKIYCLWENNGSIKWTVEHLGPGSPNYGDGTPTVANDKVYVGCGDDYVYSIYQENGTVAWTFYTPPGGSRPYGTHAAPAVYNGYVYIGACNGYVYKVAEIQPTSTAVADYSYNSGNCIFSSPVIANGRVFIGNGYSDAPSNGHFYCLDATDLSFIWRYDPTWSTSFFSSAGYYNNRIYVGSADGYLYCFDANAGSATILWQLSIGATWSSPAITNDRLYIGSTNNYLYCVNMSQTFGSEEYYWRGNTYGNVYSSPAVSDGKVYVGSRRTSPNDGQIYCFGNTAALTVDNIRIMSQSGGQGFQITNGFIDVGTQLRGYAAAYNSSIYLYDIAVDWSVTLGGLANSSTNPTGPATSSVFYSGFFEGTATWRAEDGGGLVDEVYFTINPPEVNYIRIVGSEGTGENEIQPNTVDVGYTVKGYAAGFNGTIGYVEDIIVSWSVINTSGAEGFTMPSSGTNSTLNV